MRLETAKLEITPGRTTTVKVNRPSGGGPFPGLILAHGMANDLDHGLLSAVAELAARHGFIAVRFNFLYREAGKDRADSPAKLLACVRAVHHHTVSGQPVDPKRVYLGGKSLGARISAQAAGEGLETAGLVHLGFPLQPPGRPDRGREDVIRRLGTLPQIFFAGTRDPLCPLDRLKALLAEIPHTAALHIVDGGDHSFSLPKGHLRTEEDVLGDIAQKTVEWLQAM